MKGFALIGSADYPNHHREIQRGKRGISEAILRTALRKHRAIVRYKLQTERRQGLCVVRLGPKPKATSSPKRHNEEPPVARCRCVFQIIANERQLVESRCPRRRNVRFRRRVLLRVSYFSSDLYCRDWKWATSSNSRHWQTETLDNERHIFHKHTTGPRRCFSEDTVEGSTRRSFAFRFG